MYIVTAKEMREMDRMTIESFGLPGRLLMETAGRGASRFFLDMFPDCRGRRVGVVAGRGNNGGDGFVMARCLAERGVRVTVFLLARKTDVSGEAAENLKLIDALAVPVTELPDAGAFSARASALAHQEIWIDAILGTGLRAMVKPYFKQVIDHLNASGRPVFSVDIPSGLNADTGQPCGACIRATATATFGFAKIGHKAYPGADLTGRIRVVDIGIPSPVVEKVAPGQRLITPSAAAAGLVDRPADSHKGRNGHLLVVAGSPGKTGAAVMAAVSALRAGAGLVTAAVPETLHPILETQTLEAMTCPLPDGGRSLLAPAALKALEEALSGKRCVAIGPGIGTASETRELLFELLPKLAVPVVLDADALNCLARAPQLLKGLAAPAVLTPHPGEMARLTGTDPRTVQQDRISCAREFAETYGCHLVLKGAGTAVAHPDGTVWLNATGNAGMATGGMGDVLTGLIAGLIAQGAPPGAACRTGVYLHGAAADSISGHRGPRGFLASEVMQRIPEEIGALLALPPSTYFPDNGIDL